MLETRARLSGSFFDLSVKSEAKQAYDLTSLEKNVTLRGEFYRVVMADAGIPAEKKEEVIRLGLRLLDGEVAGL